MKKNYVALQLQVCILTEDVIRTSSVVVGTDNLGNWKWSEQASWSE